MKANRNLNQSIRTALLMITFAMFVSACGGGGGGGGGGGSAEIRQFLGTMGEESWLATLTTEVDTDEKREFLRSHVADASGVTPIKADTIVEQAGGVTGSLNTGRIEVVTDVDYVALGYFRGAFSIRSDGTTPTTTGFLNGDRCGGVTESGGECLYESGIADAVGQHEGYEAHYVKVNVVAAAEIASPLAGVGFTTKRTDAAADYITFGYYVYDANKTWNDTTRAAGFASGNVLVPLAKFQENSMIEATYDGSAAGMYVQGTKHGQFAGDVRLLSLFSDTGQPLVYGTVSNINYNGTGVSLPSSVELNSLSSPAVGLAEAGGFFTGNTNAGSGVNLGSGKWGGQFYGADGQFISGTFGVSSGTAWSLIGAYGTEESATSDYAFRTAQEINRHAVALNNGGTVVNGFIQDIDDAMSGTDYRDMVTDAINNVGTPTRFGTIPFIGVFQSSGASAVVEVTTENAGLEFATAAFTATPLRGGNRGPENNTPSFAVTFPNSTRMYNAYELSEGNPQGSEGIRFPRPGPNPGETEYHHPELAEVLAFTNRSTRESNTDYTTFGIWLIDGGSNNDVISLEVGAFASGGSTPTPTSYLRPSTAVEASYQGDAVMMTGRTSSAPNSIAFGTVDLTATFASTPTVQGMISDIGAYRVNTPLPSTLILESADITNVAGGFFKGEVRDGPRDIGDWGGNFYGLDAGVVSGTFNVDVPVSALASSSLPAGTLNIVGAFGAEKQ